MRPLVEALIAAIVRHSSLGFCKCHDRLIDEPAGKLLQFARKEGRGFF